MSLLADFAATAFDSASAVIGMEPLTISDGPPIQVVLNESEFSQESEDGGFEQIAALDAVVRVDVFRAAYPGDIQRNKATARGKTWRVAKVRPGASFVAIVLISPNKSGA